MLEKHICIGMEGYQVIWGMHVRILCRAHSQKIVMHKVRKRLTDICFHTTYILQHVYCGTVFWLHFCIDCEARDIMYLVASVRPSACPSFCQLCRVQQRAKKSYCQSMVFVCVLNNHADAVDRLLRAKPCRHF